MTQHDFIPDFWALQAAAFPRNLELNRQKKNILIFFLTKLLTNRFLYTIFRFVSGGQSLMTGCESNRGDQRFRLPPTFSLLWTRGPSISLECPFSFSPFLPSGAPGNTAGNGVVFFHKITISESERRIFHVFIDTHPAPAQNACTTLQRQNFFHHPPNKKPAIWRDFIRICKIQKHEYCAIEYHYYTDICNQYRIAPHSPTAFLYRPQYSPTTDQFQHCI